jgi:hypothetical protein
MGQRAPLLEPASGLPVAPAVQPSLDAVEPSGFWHETWIQVPARAEEAATHVTISAASVAAMMPRRPIALLLKLAEL